MQHGPAFADGVHTRSIEHTSDVAAFHRRAGNANRGCEGFAAEPPAGDRENDGRDLDLRRALGLIDRAADGFLRRFDIDHSAGLDAMRAGMAEPAHLDRMRAVARHIAAALCPELRDHAGDLARADVQRGNDRRALATQRLHAGRDHDAPFFFVGARCAS